MANTTQWVLAQLAQASAAMPPLDDYEMWELDVAIPHTFDHMVAVLTTLCPKWYNTPMDHLFTWDYGDDPADQAGNSVVCLVTRTYTLLVLAYRGV